MPQCLRPLVVVFGLALSGLLAGLSPAWAQQGQKPSLRLNGPADDRQEVLETADLVDRELVRLGVRKEHVPAARQPRVHVVPSPMALSTVWGNRSRQEQRVFAAQLTFANLTAEPVTIRRDEIRLTADGQTLTLGEASELPQGVQIGTQHRSPSQLQTPETCTIPAGQTRSVWVAFADLPQTADTPKLRLHLPAGGKPLEIDVNQFARGLLRMTVERIGPRQALGLMTISGPLDPVSVGSLVEELDRLVQAKVARVVIRWADTVPRVDPYVLGWLYQSADRAGREFPAESNQFHLPTLPVSIRELHLADVPKGSHSYLYGDRGGARVHEDAAAAVGAALATALRTLPADELLQQIETGHPLVRAAALRAGGRLGVAHLPVLLRYAESADDDLQQAAAQALGQFGDPAAVGKLVALAGADDKPLAAVAVESLAASRYAAAHHALHGYLQENPRRITPEVIRALARHPRPLWADTIYGFAQDLRSPLGAEALRALVLIGHPRLMDLLERALREGNETVRREAFRVLAQRGDERSEQLALDSALKQLRAGAAVEGELQELLRRTRDPRAVAPLLERLQKPRDTNRSGDRSPIIHLLAQIGDQRTADVLVEHYPQLNPSEQSATLKALIQLQSPYFLRLAKGALKSDDNSLINTATQGLANDGSDEAVRLLIAAFEDPKNQRGWDDAAQALAQIGTPAARQALQKAWESGETSKHHYSAMHLQNMRHRSPGYQYVMQGVNSLREGNLEQAEKQFAFAKKLDPDLADSYAHLGSLRLAAGQQDAARQEFEAALQRDPYCIHATAGLAMLTVLDGKPAEGIQRIERVRDKYKHVHQAQFAYRAASVYGLAMQQAQDDTALPNRAEQAAAYRAKAVDELEKAVKQNPFDAEYIRHDPDMKSLRDLPEFRKLFGAPEEAADGAAPLQAPMPPPIAAPRLLED